LRFLGEADQGEAAAALASANAPATIAVMGPVTGRFGQRVLHVPVAGLDVAAAAVRDAFGGDAEEEFTGHLTLARVRGRRRVDLRPLCGVPLEGEWPVTEIKLVASQLDPDGARYETVAHVPLS
jgi:2'-5' RNA ligase